MSRGRRRSFSKRMHHVHELERKQMARPDPARRMMARPMSPSEYAARFQSRPAETWADVYWNQLEEMP